MTKTATLSPAQTDALARIRRDGVLYPYNGVSVATVRALAARGLVAVETRPAAQVYGAAGPAGGRNRGSLVADWVARPAS
jgi:nicotinamide mononucleotide (NMN) deamidase PncC